MTLGAETDAFEMPLLVSEPMRPETTAAYGDTTATATETVALPAGVLPGAGGLTVELASTALVGLGESARYLTEYPYECAEQKASRALALLLASDLGGAFTISGHRSRRVPRRGRSRAARALRLSVHRRRVRAVAGAVRQRVRVPHGLRPACDERRRARCKVPVDRDVGRRRAELPATGAAAAAAGECSGGRSGRRRRRTR